MAQYHKATMKAVSQYIEEDPQFVFKVRADFRKYQIKTVPYYDRETDLPMHTKQRLEKECSYLTREILRD